ncbi:MAG: family 20 glycosylhydrolase [Armatimonadetes bacterium]|nr:family 20 glycosylhydrolase [Armatimonadota bacterium]
MPAFAVLLLLAAPPGRVVLHDFEAGIAGWWTNPWGGGKITAAADSAARYGHGALRGDFALADGKLNGNLVGPFYPPDAAWREQPWGALSLWYRTSGEVPKFNVSLTRLAPEGEPELTFTWTLPASPEWQRLVLEPRMLWNREGQALDLRRLGRIIVHGGAPGTIGLDQLALLPPRRELPLEPWGGPAHLFELAPGRYQVEAPAQPGESWTAEVLLPAGKPASAKATAGDDDPLLELSSPYPREGRGRLTVTTAAGRRELTFPVLLPQPEPPIAPLGIFPTPKQCRATGGAWALPRELPVQAAGTAASQCAAELASRLAKLGVTVQPTVRAATGTQTIRLGRAPQLEPSAGLPAEGYQLAVAAGGAAIAARDDRGLFYGTLSLLQMAESASRPGAARLPTATVKDWPALPVRAVSIPLPTGRWGYPNDTPVPVGFYLDFLDRMVVRHKLNMVILILDQGMKLDRHPVVDGPAAWTKDEVKQVAAFLRDRFIDPVPLVNSLGHAEWLLIPLPALAEDRVMQKNRDGQLVPLPDIHTLCTRHPDAWRTLTDVYDEAIECFGPKWFHCGLDEVRWQTLDTAEELRCERCRGADKADLMAEWVNRLHDWLAERGLRMMMWTDMLTAGHNGGPPYRTARVLDGVPRDTWMCNWSSSIVPQHTWELRSKGFRNVLDANSEGLNRERAAACAGNLLGMWDKTCWTAETVAGAKEYAWPMLLHAAEYSWRLHPDLAEPKPATTAAFLRAVAEVTAAEVLQPEPAAGAKVTPLAPPADGLDVAEWFDGPPPPVSLRDIAVPLWPKALLPGGAVAVGRPAAAVYLLVAMDGSADELQQLRDGFKDKANFAGRPVATVEVRYTDSTADRIELRYGWDVRARRAEALPPAYGAVACRVYPARNGGGTAVYLRQWVAPHPEKVIGSLALVGAEVPGRVVLLGAATREAQTR